ncbi:hypothetical protein NE237_015512 [Protea cynaroides]|uniref:S-protein homolog n=1 Tax=Protea cynaroides TaxID=273540 RepID=A0A9Q0KEE5_9MAGN|nr:hypothetical protein NE237_015512 [Protea cynaroides]
MMMMMMMTMGKSNSMVSTRSSFVILFVMALIILCQPYEAQGIFEKYHVNITNDLGVGYVLKVHCKSKNDDLGWKLLDNGKFYEWSFHMNFLHTTLFFCKMEWSDIHSGSFVVFDANRDMVRCDTVCFWSARQDGLYGYSDVHTQKTDYYFKWSS